MEKEEKNYNFVIDHITIIKKLSGSLAALVPT